jgi:hypothetical protein
MKSKQERETGEERTDSEDQDFAVLQLCCLKYLYPPSAPLDPLDIRSRSGTCFEQTNDPLRFLHVNPLQQSVLLEHVWCAQVPVTVEEGGDGDGSWILSLYRIVLSSGKTQQACRKYGVTSAQFCWLRTFPVRAAS